MIYHRHHNHISYLSDAQGNLVTQCEDIEWELINFYGSILSDPPGNKDLTIQKIVHNIPKLVINSHSISSRWVTKLPWASQRYEMWLWCRWLIIVWWNNFELMSPSFSHQTLDSFLYKIFSFLYQRSSWDYISSSSLILIFLLEWFIVEFFCISYSRSFSD